MAMPKWATTDRKNTLLELWQRYGNRCLKGHTVCPIREHYTYAQSKVVLVPQAKRIACVNGGGDAIRDDNGNQLYLTVYSLRKVYTKTEREARLYDLIIEAVISDWQAEDRDTDKAERATIHNLNEPRYSKGGSGLSQGKCFLAINRYTTLKL